MPRQRSARKRGWPDYLYEVDGYFSWRHPLTRKTYGLGRDKAGAFAEARAANALVAEQHGQTSLVDRISGEHTAGELLIELRAEWETRHKAKEIATATRNTWRSTSKHMDTLADRFLKRIETKDIVAIIKTLREAGKDRAAQAFRSFAITFFDAAKVRGWFYSDRDNPAELTAKFKVSVKRVRLTPEVYKAILAKAIEGQAWEANAFALALITAQRLEDITAFQFHDYGQRDGVTGWQCEPIKTVRHGTRILIPGSLRMNCMGDFAGIDWSLEGIVRRCRDRIVSRYAIHQTRRAATSRPGDQLSEEIVSRRFAAYRDSLGLTFDGTPPTFHEIRSLAKRLYLKQGNVDTDVLLAHKDPKSAARYADARGHEYALVRVA